MRKHYTANSVRVLFLVPWPADAASTRLRVEQYLPYLRQQGIEPVLRPFMSPALYRMVYKPGHTLRKIGHVLASTVARLPDIVRASRADLVVVHREALPFGTTLIERAIAAVGTPMVLDFDDAIYLPTTSSPNHLMRYLKRANKVDRLIGMSRAVVVGNAHLQRYALRYNPRTLVIPTPVDTSVYSPRESRGDEHVVIGWIGSGTTSRYLELVERPLARLLERYANVRVELVGAAEGSLANLPRVHPRAWSRSNELDMLRGFDIGLMPYPDNEWALGKCAFKALLYMSVGVPAVCSAVGMVEEAVDSGRNGFLAHTEDEWFDILDSLVADPQLRRRVGQAGRERATSDFSLERWAPRFLDVLRSAALGRPVVGEELFVRS
jgi:glycosyltransferase involved in cell wall biosynthesis